MSFLNPFVKTKKIPPASANISEDISIDNLKELIPIRTFGEEKLQAFATNNKSEIVPADQILFRQGEPTDSAVYLLKGVMVLSDFNGNTFEVQAGTAKAKFPISGGALYTTTAFTKTDVSILRVSQKIMVTQKNDSTFSELVIPDELAESRLLQLFSHHYLTETLEIPSLPAVAIQLRKAMQNDIGIADAVKIIQLDPVISGKLIEVANCPLYISAIPAKSCLAAISRIGLNATRNLVIALSIQSIFKNRSLLIQKYLDQAWKNSLYISTLCHVLASVSKQANPEEALLAGLVCDIGVIPFLHFAANIPENYYTEAELQQALPYVKGAIGYKVLVDWQFPEEFIHIPVYSEDWYQNNSPKLNLTDIVVLSRLHSKIGQPDCPPITSIPATSKLKNFSLSPELSLNILHEAKQQINDSLRAFSN